jgi:hypothetical protein
VTEVLQPYDKLFPLVVLGKVLEVPENNLLLRQLQFVAPEVGYGRYCWNCECRYCEVRYRIGDGPEFSGLACRMKGVPGMALTKLAAEIRVNIRPVLDQAEASK